MHFLSDVRHFTTESDNSGVGTKGGRDAVSTGIRHKYGLNRISQVAAEEYQLHQCFGTDEMGIADIPASAALRAKIGIGKAGSQARRINYLSTRSPTHTGIRPETHLKRFH